MASHLVQRLVKSINTPFARSLNPALSQLLQSFQLKIEMNKGKTRDISKQIVHVNNSLILGDIKVLGFDLDYTLVTYSDDLQLLIYSLAKDVLIKTFAFPSELKHVQFDPNFAIRGLFVDPKNGILCKLSHLQRIGTNFTFKGRKKLDISQIEHIYGESRHISYENLKAMRRLNDLFSIAEGCLIADCIDCFENTRERTGEQYSAPAIIDDVQAAIKNIHVSGALHDHILADMQRYIVYNPKLGKMLEHMQVSGKRLFLCTNSNYRYTNLALTYALHGSSEPLKNKENANEWKKYFDIIVCSAKKPNFYFSEQPLRKWNTVLDLPSTQPVSDLSKGEVYVGGSVHDLLQKMRWSSYQVLYVGDNLQADLVEARRQHGWHTACVIREVEKEIDIHASANFNECHFLRSSTRRLLQQLQKGFEQSKVGRDGLHGNYSKQELEMLCSLEADLQAINSEMSSMFNEHFGSIFRTDGHPSLYAFAIKRYADIYMSDVSVLQHYNPLHRFYPNTSIHMAHEDEEDIS